MSTATKQSKLYQQPGQSMHDLPCHRESSHVISREKHYESLALDLIDQMSGWVEYDSDGDLIGMELTADIPLDAEAIPLSMSGTLPNGDKFAAEWDNRAEIIQHRTPATVGQCYHATDRWLRVTYSVGLGD